MAFKFYARGVQAAKIKGIKAGFNEYLFRQRVPKKWPKFNEKLNKIMNNKEIFQGNCLKSAGNGWGLANSA